MRKTRENIEKNETWKCCDYKISSFKEQIKSKSAITLVALVVTILFSYDEMIKFSNSKGFLLATI